MRTSLYKYVQISSHLSHDLTGQQMELLLQPEGISQSQIAAFYGRESIEAPFTRVLAAKAQNLTTQFKSMAERIKQLETALVAAGGERALLLSTPNNRPSSPDLSDGAEELLDPSIWVSFHWSRRPGETPCSTAGLDYFRELLPVRDICLFCLFDIRALKTQTNIDEVWFLPDSRALELPENVVTPYMHFRLGSRPGPMIRIYLLRLPTLHRVKRLVDLYYKAVAWRYVAAVCFFYCILRITSHRCQFTYDRILSRIFWGLSINHLLTLSTLTNWPSSSRSQLVLCCMKTIPTSIPME